MCTRVDKVADTESASAARAGLNSQPILEPGENTSCAQDTYKQDSLPDAYAVSVWPRQDLADVDSINDTTHDEQQLILFRADFRRHTRLFTGGSTRGGRASSHAFGAPLLSHLCGIASQTCAAEHRPALIP